MKRTKEKPQTLTPKDLALIKQLFRTERLTLLKIERRLASIEKRLARLEKDRTKDIEQIMKALVMDQLTERMDRYMKSLPVGYISTPTFTGIFTDAAGTLPDSIVKDKVMG